jgi:IMP dehydrogenase/GMP reductase
MKKALAFDDVLLRPLYSEIRSRSNPDTSTSIAGIELKIPMISSPMDTVTESRMAIAMGENGGMGIIHRFMSNSSQADNIRDVCDAEQSLGINLPKVFAIGVGQEELERFSYVKSQVPFDAVAIDIANGHHTLMKEMIENLRKIDSEVRIIAGNIATIEGYSFLADLSVDAIRVGIGSGCFVPGSLVMTRDGYKPIESINIGDHVLTHQGRMKEVINTMTFYREEEIVNINNICCTKSHEFYVVKKSDAELVTEENIEQYAFWIEAEHLDKEVHLLIELG